MKWLLNKFYYFFALLVLYLWGNLPVNYLQLHKSRSQKTKTTQISLKILSIGQAKLTSSLYNLMKTIKIRFLGFSGSLAWQASNLLQLCPVTAWHITEYDKNYFLNGTVTFEPTWNKIITNENRRNPIFFAYYFHQRFSIDSQSE